MNTIQLVRTKELKPHPLNRSFEKTGPEWAEFVADVKGAGVRVPLTVRRTGPDAGTVEILAGHRRAAAAGAAGIKAVPCLFVEMDDKAALEFLVAENLQREGLTPVDEALLCKALAEANGWDSAAVARCVHRSEEWVRTGQGMLKLGDEVLLAVKSKDANKNLAMGSVAEILRVPEQWRPEAVQMVLHPSFDDKPLRPAAAAQYLEQCLLRPRKLAAVWEAGKDKIAAGWLRKLREMIGKKAGEGLVVRAADYAERETVARGAVMADAKVPLGMLTPDAPAGLLWAGLAARHGLVVMVVPGDDADGETRAVCNPQMVRLGEETLAKHGGAAWLVTGPPRREERVEKALKDLDGTPDEDAEGDPAETVIEQKMEWHGVIDLGAVKRLAMWAVDGESDPTKAPAWVPKWAVALAMAAMWEQLDGACNWIMELRKGGGNDDGKR